MTLIQEKIEQAAGLLKEFGIDCWITFTRESEICGDPTLVFLAPGPVTWHSAFIVCADGRTRAIVGLYDQRGIEETGAYDKVVGYVTRIKEPLLEFLKDVDPRSIAVNYSKASEICDGLTHGMYLTLRDFLAEAGLAERLGPAEKIVSALRERKSSAEIGWMKQAVRATEEIFDLVGRFIAPGRTESEIAAFILAEAGRRKLPTAWGQATCPAVFTGPDTAQAHYSPTGRTVEPGHVLNMDFGVKIEGYCSDMQRTFYILAPGEASAPDDVMKGFRTILRTVEESKAAMKPGVEGRAIDAVARSIVVEAGYAEFPHALGHQVGRFAHDGTAILGPAWEKYAQKPFQKLEEGMVFTIEPRLTVPGRGVVTIEEMVVVTKDGAEWLGRPQKDIVLVGGKA
jgi:Xaa-Pro aminopeptidase